MPVTLSPSLIASILAVPNNPRTAEEWIIGGINYLHSGGSGTGDIKSDGSVNFSGRETFDAGLFVNAGAVGAVAVGWAADQGIYQVSGTQVGFSTGGTLVGGFDANGLFTGTISEQNVAAGVTIAGTGGLKTNLINDNGGGLSISSTSTGGGYNISLHGNTAIAIGDIDVDVNGTILKIATNQGANGAIQMDNNNHDTELYINGVQGGTGAIDTAVTPVLTFNNGIFISAA